MIREVENFIHIMKENHCIDISIFENSFLENILKTRMNELAITHTEDYFLYLKSTAGECEEIKSHRYNSYSEFFRNTLTFCYIEHVLLPLMIHRKLTDHEKEIRIWSSACASGQEAYTLAILFDEMSERTSSGVDCHIFATDINPAQLESARKGIYPEGALNKVLLKRVNTYFTHQNKRYKITSKLGKYIDFSVFDLLSDTLNCPPASIYGNFDMVFCTNVLFYYNNTFRQRIIHKVGNCIAPGGFLIVGDSEAEMIKGYKFREVFPNSGIFQKR